ncbi:hypothetical protein C0L86_01905 [Streptomyces sp. SCA2-2]|nr:hypothetical protein C0L86_01905 [Streptomyces sp. SCA2-2]
MAPATTKCGARNSAPAPAAANPSPCPAISLASAGVSARPRSGTGAASGVRWSRAIAYGWPSPLTTSGTVAARSPGRNVKRSSGTKTSAADGSSSRARAAKPATWGLGDRAQQ